MEEVGTVNAVGAGELVMMTTFKGRADVKSMIRDRPRPKALIYSSKKIQ